MINFTSIFNSKPPSSHQPPPIRPIFGLFLGILAVSTAAIFIRFAQGYAPSLVIAAYRLSVATLVLFPYVWFRHRAEIRSLKGKRLNLALLSGLFLALHFASWITSLEYTSIASSVVLVTTTPLWVALLSPFTIKESMTRPVLLGMGLALVGGITVGMSDACTLSTGRLACPSIVEMVKGAAFLGDLLALFGALMGASYLMIGRRLRETMSLGSYVFVVYGVAAVVLGLFVGIARQPLLGYPPSAYLWFGLLALIPQLFGHSVFNWALRYLSAAYVSITLLGEPIGSTILAYILLQERPTNLKLFGAILILAGIYVAAQSEVES